LATLGYFVLSQFSPKQTVATQGFLKFQKWFDAAILRFRGLI